MFKNIAKLSLIILSFSLVSCLNNDDRKYYLPSSAGELAEVVVIFDKKNSTPDFKDSLEQVFAEGIEGLPIPSEPKFKILFTDESFFKGYFKEHHNIFILLTPENLDVMSEVYGEKNRAAVEKIIENKKVLGFNKQDVWAENQNVAYITAGSKEELYTKLRKRSSEIVALALKHEMQTGTKKVLTISTAKDTFYQGSMNRNGYAFRKPSSYRLAMVDTNFYWFKKNTDYGIFLYESPYNSEADLSLDSIISRRNAITKKFVPGELEGTYMKIDERFTPYQEEVEINGRYGKAVKGWWNLYDDHMAGPFTLRAIHDKETNRIITIEGYVYRPNQSKAKLLRELEVILQSLQIK